MKFDPAATGIDETRTDKVCKKIADSILHDG